MRQELTAPAERIVKLANSELGGLSTEASARAFRALAARRALRARRRRTLLGAGAALAFAAALVLVGSRFFAPASSEVLSYAVEGGKVLSTGAVEASGTVDPTLRFSDGTEIVFLEGAEGRVKSVSDQGARIDLRGKVRVAVVPWPGSRWLFDAGPFLITVTGTDFTAEWRDAEQRLEVTLVTGSIAVNGPLSDEPINLRAGQRLVISGRKQEVLIANIDSPSTTKPVASGQTGLPEGSEPSLRSGTSPEGEANDSRAPAPSASASGFAKSNWTAELAAGRLATILSEAEQRGLDAVLAEASSAELAALSDAARYSRRDDLARRALVAQRRRFPGSARANDAAFLLGRMDETAGRLGPALTWYEQCLSDAPNGTYASEALGRKLNLVRRLHGTARARPVAEEYLRRFENGTYAAAARAVLRAR